MIFSTQVFAESPNIPKISIYSITSETEKATIFRDYSEKHEGENLNMISISSEHALFMWHYSSDHGYWRVGPSPTRYHDANYDRLPGGVADPNKIEYEDIEIEFPVAKDSPLHDELVNAEKVQVNVTLGESAAKSNAKIGVGQLSVTMENLYTLVTEMTEVRKMKKQFITIKC